MIIKICGMTNVNDIQIALKAGADLIGVIVDVPRSKRKVTLTSARELIKSYTAHSCILAEGKTARKIATEITPLVFQVVPPYTTQDISDLAEVFCGKIWPVLTLPPQGEPWPDISEILEMIAHLKTSGASHVILDTAKKGTHGGGSGMISDWTLAAKTVQEACLPVILAGGLTPDNVTDAVTSVAPAGVDTSSGTEDRPRIKSIEKILSFISRARSAEPKDS